MAELQGIQGIPTDPQLRRPETYHDRLQGLKSKIFKDSVMEPGFIESLTAPEGSPIDYQNISSVAGGRARELFVDPMRRFGGSIEKGVSGKPLTIGDQLNLIEGMIDTTVGGLFQHGVTKGGFDPNTLHMFVGPKAKDIVKAEKMAMRGASPAEIQSKLLMHKKPDGFWRKEISDVPAKLNKLIESGDVEKWDLGMFGIDAGKTLEHPELYKQYPEISDIPTAGKVRDQLSDLADALEGRPATKYSGTFSEGGITVDAPIEKFKPVLGHELQHAVQQKEGWARGGSPEQFKAPSKNSLEVELNRYKNEINHRNKTYEKGDNDLYIYDDEELYTKISRLERKIKKAENVPTAHEQYQNLLGEREARSTAERLGMSLEERRGILPDVGEGATVLMR